MARTEVSAVVKDILDAFQNGLTIFKSSGRRHKRRQSEPANAPEEKRIHDSLTRRPEEIRTAYDQSVVKHGQRFEVGDSASQTTLAQILLRLNTGLIKLLNAALSNDRPSRSKSGSGIFNLSEAAAIDTLSALSELNLRLVSASTINLGLPAPQRAGDYENKGRARPRAQSCSQANKRPPPTPLLHYGGWVRSKTDPSVVSVVVSNRIKKTDIRRGSTSRSSSATRPRSTPNPQPVGLPGSKSPPPRYSRIGEPGPESGRQHEQAQQAQSDGDGPSERQIVRHPSMYIVPSDFFDALPQSYVPKNLYRVDEQQGRPPPRPPKVPIHSHPQWRQAENLETSDRRYHGRVRPPSMMTIRTASTKIGEIPEHKLPDRELTETQQQQIPMPYVVPDMLVPRKKRGRGLKFWKRERQGPDTVHAVAA